jgi:hypothetical protein
MLFPYQSPRLQLPRGGVDFPFWSHSGFNSGVLLLDLARLDDWGFAQRVQSILMGHQLANSTMLLELPDNNVLNTESAPAPPDALAQDAIHGRRRRHRLQGWHGRVWAAGRLGERKGAQG